MTPRLRSNRAVHGIGVDDCEMRERLAPHRDCVQCRMVEDAVLDAIEETRREMLLPCAAGKAAPAAVADAAEVAKPWPTRAEASGRADRKGKK